MRVSDTIDQATLVNLVQAGTVNGANVIGQPGGWEVVVRYGRVEKALSAKRGQVRLFRKLDTLDNFLRGIGLAQYQVDARKFDPEIHKSLRTNDAARERLQNAHAAAAYDKWFSAEVEQAIQEADDPNTKWISNDDVKAESAKRRAIWSQRAKAQQVSVG